LLVPTAAPMTEAQRSAAMACVFGVSKLVLMKLSADARVQGDTRSFSLAVLRGAMGGANFVLGAASALQLGLALSSRVTRLSRAGWTLGVALVYFVLLHVLGRKLFVGDGLDAFHNRVRQIKHQREQLKQMNKAKQWQKLDEERQAKEAAAKAAAEPEPEKVAPPAPEPEPEPEPEQLAFGQAGFGATSYTIG